jgi:hypothetical protein
MKMPSGLRANSCVRLVLRMDSGRRRRSSPSSAKMPKAWSCTSGMQRVEVGDPISAEHDGIAVDDEAGLAHLVRRLDDPRIAVGKVVAALGDQADAVGAPGEADSCRT